jgi:crossover junction endodeoxyribonuclease RuvC
MTARRILGIDPGLRTTGYGVIDVTERGVRLVEAGVLASKATEPLEKRLCALHDGLADLLAATEPEIMVVEDLWTSYKNPSTAVLMGHARGVLYYAAGARGVSVAHLAHAQWKRALAGSGSATKERVGMMVAQLLGLTTVPEPIDVSDALALALAYANRAR